MRTMLAGNDIEYLRHAWVSAKAQQIWAPRLKRIVKAWSDIEWLSVAEGVRRCALASASPETLLSQGGVYLQHNLVCLPLALVGNTPGIGYSSKMTQYEPGRPFGFRTVIGRLYDVKEFSDAWRVGDNPRVADLLGYPDCCGAFFQNVWIERKLLDTTWPMALASQGTFHGKAHIEVGNTPETNILWRWMGVRSVPHLPCSFVCDKTRKLAGQMLSVGSAHGYAEEVAWIRTILSWPIEWTATNGICEVQTPILKFMAPTDTASENRTVRLRSDFYPEEAAPGVRFPFLQSIEESNAHISSGPVDGPSSSSVLIPEWMASDNGFQSIRQQEDAHRTIVDEVVKRLRGKKQAAVMDLGCGNGALLLLICQKLDNVEPFGVDVNADRIAHARLLHPRYVQNFHVGDMFTLQSLWKRKNKYDLVLLMPGRFLEAPSKQGEWLKKRLSGKCEDVLAYAYGDWLRKYDSLAGLVKTAGFIDDGSMENKSLAMKVVINSGQKAKTVPINQ